MLNSLTNKRVALLESPQAGAKENMAIDKALLEAFKPSSIPILRLYSWSPSFTYGISQKPKDIKPFSNLEYAQRMTGGGILFHGNDISYSLILPVSYLKNFSVKESYEVICLFLMRFYHSLGLEPTYAKDKEEIILSSSAYCQEGFEPYDIIIDDKKIGGNAQRRGREVIFQHGSIPLYRSQYHTMGYTLEDVGICIDFQEAKKLLLEAFKKTFHILYEPYQKD